MSARRRPIGYFVHHQGRGHAERCAAWLDALSPDREAVVFCAKPSTLPPMRAGVELVEVPSLFEPSGEECPTSDRVPRPETVHCAPLGWPGIRRATARLTEWFERADPALLVVDVSAEIAQLARLCSVPHVCVLQHGEREDVAHRAAFDGAAGLLAPFDRVLAQPEWPAARLARTHFAPGLGVRTALPERAAARERLGIAPDETIHLVLSGGGGEGFASAALGVGARTVPDASWHTVGTVRASWHATEPGNLVHHGWVEDVPDRIAAADLVVSSAGNTVCQQVLAAGVPWIVVPEWCYFDEQSHKARALARARLAHVEAHLPSHADAWRRALASARAGHDAARQRACIDADAARAAARWLDALCATLWDERPHEGRRVTGSRGAAREAACRIVAPAVATRTVEVSDRPRAAEAGTAPDGDGTVSVLTLGRGRARHLHNLVLGLERQRRTPAELVVGVMQDRPYENLPTTRFPVRQIPIEGGASLPLARARNAVARAAAHDSLVFLDIDCVPDETLVADYATHVAPGAGLLMGEVLYLPAGAAEPGWTHADLAACGVRHDARAAPPRTPLERCGDYRCFWSLSFAIDRGEFVAAGGFDEGYEGYGAEDTDFARTLEGRGVPISWVRGARAFHQYHAQRMPPVQHLESVVRNAERFADKWGHRTMEHWLHCFALLGLIEDGPSGVRILRAATEAGERRCAPPEARPFASTAEVTERLEREVRARHHREHGRAPPAAWFDRKRFLHRPSAPVPGNEAVFGEAGPPSSEAGRGDASGTDARSSERERRDRDGPARRALAGVFAVP